MKRKQNNNRHCIRVPQMQAGEWLLPLAMLILTTINIAYLFYKKGEIISKIEGAERRTDSIQKKSDDTRINNKAMNQIIIQHLSDICFLRQPC